MTDWGMYPDGLLDKMKAFDLFLLRLRRTATSRVEQEIIDECAKNVTIDVARVFDWLSWNMDERKVLEQVKTLCETHTTCMMLDLMRCHARAHEANAERACEEVTGWATPLVSIFYGVYAELTASEMGQIMHEKAQKPRMN